MSHDDIRPETADGGAPEVDITAVIEAWRRTPDQHRTNPGATEAQIREAEEILERPIPAAMRAVYQFSNGAEFVGGNLMMHPVVADKGTLCLAYNSDLLRSWQWGIPEEVVVFGTDGSDSVYGIWLPRRSGSLADAPIIEIGSPDEEMRYMALAGSSFAAFARWRTAYCLHPDAPDTTAGLDAIDVPDTLREGDFSDEHFAKIVRWADPSLPHYPPDPFVAPATLDWLRQRWSNM